MAELSEKLTLKSLQKHIILIVITALFTSLGTGTAFYFNTNNTLSNHTVEIKEVKENVKSVDDKVTNLDNKVNLLGLQPTQVQDIQESIKTLSQRQDKMYELLIQINKRN